MLVEVFRSDSQAFDRTLKRIPYYILIVNRNSPDMTISVAIRN